MKNIAFITYELPEGHRDGDIEGYLRYVRMKWISYRAGYSMIEAIAWDTIIIDRNVLLYMDNDWWGAMLTHSRNIVIV